MSVETITKAPTKLTIYPDTDRASNRAVSDNSATKSKDEQHSSTGADADYSFWDFLDMINPLQHIPVINTLYREATGDTIKPEMKLAGGAVLGGVIGFVASLADVIFEQETGKDIGSTMVAAVFGDDAKDAPLQVAKTDSTQHPAPSIQETELQASLNAIQSQTSKLDYQSAQVLALYGASTPPEQASRAYQQANMRAYLQQSSVNATF